MAFTKRHVADLKSAVETTNGGATFFATDAAMKPLLDAGLVEKNENMKDGRKFAYRATAAGVKKLPEIEQEAVNTTTNTEGKARAERKLPEFPDDYDFDIAEDRDMSAYQAAKAAGRKSIIPYEKLTRVGMSLRIRPTDRWPTPVENLKPNVATVNRTYQKAGRTERFEIRVDGDDALIFRTA